MTICKTVSLNSNKYTVIMTQQGALFFSVYISTTGANRQLYTPKIQAAIMAELVAQDHAEALEINKAYPLSQKQKDAIRQGGIEIMHRAHPFLLEEDHVLALKMNEEIDAAAVQAHPTGALLLASESGFSIEQCIAELEAEDGNYIDALIHLRGRVEDDHELALVMDKAISTAILKPAELDDSDYSWCLETRLRWITSNKVIYETAFAYGYAFHSFASKCELPTFPQACRAWLYMMDQALEMNATQN